MIIEIAYGMPKVSLLHMPAATTQSLLTYKAELPAHVVVDQSWHIQQNFSHQDACMVKDGIAFKLCATFEEEQGWVKVFGPAAFQADCLTCLPGGVDPHVQDHGPRDPAGDDDPQTPAPKPVKATRGHGSVAPAAPPKKRPPPLLNSGKLPCLLDS